MALKIIIIGFMFYFVGLFLGWRINKTKHKEELLQLNQMWGEITTYILENNAAFNSDGVFEGEHSRGNIRIEKVNKGQAEE